MPPTTKERIVEAAVSLFATHGYRDTTVIAIADAVGLSDAGVLHHFPTKRAIFAAVVQLFADLQAERFAAMIQPGGLLAITNLAGWGAIMEERPDLLRLQVLLSAEGIIESSDLHEYWRDRYRDLPLVLGRLFQQAIVAGEIRPDTDAEGEARALIAHLDGARLQWSYSGGQVSIADSFHTYIHQLLDRIT